MAFFYVVWYYNNLPYEEQIFFISHFDSGAR